MITDAMVEAAVEAWEKRYDADCDPGERWRDNRYHAMRAALSAALPAAWQDIETAPVGEIVMLYWPHWSHNPCFGTLTTHPTRTVLHWVSDVALTDDGPGPTHWMPLPAPPTDGGGR